ncbi:GatB/YqeY domain-containing protein [Helicobacter saguini]|uniref:GatB/YqeY domain-containing protein n=1 Tax=Helicobacter saguini TaxID=1548018 RepID=A0A347VSY4_9HELI|nr:GatB/YqeY domain-containing protein [Helicobacter saguini]MWV62317.1 GatB/YqeY domain-containing protein [Helicobacter saguini]MWV67012.1 GatB/YqeY domain-containing protein [Helicobacter saguini]MWV69360.1 GatB/YqeY domain-containing protein [Helicobacter saguini]MWV71085.1 GatB/YqeY domain-containing protein [Helicobacter saguini]TLD95017.1 GatB/YqeY domain-containing protein [Helicobacter saguini]
MSIRAKLKDDIKDAMKNKDAARRDALRVLDAALKQVEVDKRITLSDEDCIDILKTALKQREDALESYKNAGRSDLADKESYEISLIMEYLPAQLSDSELESKLKEIIVQVNAKDSKDLGKVMGAAKVLSNVATGKRISEMAKKLLS